MPGGPDLSLIQKDISSFLLGIAEAARRHGCEVNIQPVGWEVTGRPTYIGVTGKPLRVYIYTVEEDEGKKLVVSAAVMSSPAGIPLEERRLEIPLSALREVRINVYTRMGKSKVWVGRDGLWDLDFEVELASSVEVRLICPEYPGLAGVEVKVTDFLR